MTLKEALEIQRVIKQHVRDISRGTTAYNVSGTSGLTCKCNGWKEHWKRYCESEIWRCVVLECEATATVGAHIRLNRKSAKEIYIAPFCGVHNHFTQTGTLTLDHRFKVVSAASTDLCFSKRTNDRLIAYKTISAQRSKNK